MLFLLMQQRVRAYCVIWLQIMRAYARSIVHIQIGKDSFLFYNNAVLYVCICFENAYTVCHKRNFTTFFFKQLIEYDQFCDYRMSNKVAYDAKAYDAK